MSTTPISSASSAGLSGMQAAQRKLDASAHNIANMQTPQFQRQRVAQTEAPNLGGVATHIEPSPLKSGDSGLGDFSRLADDVVAQHTSLYSFAANLKTVKTQHDMLGALLDAKA